MFPFTISGFQEAHLLRAGGAASAYILNITFSALLFAGLMLFAALGNFNPASYLAAALIGPALMILIAIVIHYNDLVFLLQRAKRNWSNIDVALKKRNDLIPQLEHIIKESLAHEKSLLTRLTELRTDGEPNIHQAQNLSPQLTQSHEASVQIIASIEALPQINSSSTVAQLTRQLIACENDIAFTSSGFNDAVETYNTRINSLPDMILAKTFGFRPLSHLQHPPEKIPMAKMLKDI